MLENVFLNTACDNALRSIAAGDKGALAVIYDKMHRQIYSAAWAVLNNRHDAEDALQNTLCEILISAETYEGPNAKAWIISVARNQALNLLRKRKNEVLPLSETEKASDLNVESEFIYLDALSSLGEREREAVILKIYCKMKHKEIAALLGITPSASEKLYQRGLSKLRKYYKGG